MSAIATIFKESKVTELTTRRKILIGGLGALTPIVLNLLVVDLKTTFASITALVLVGYLIRVVGLFYLGGAVAWIHDERSPVKLFELGIIAPALITAFMNGTTTVKDANLRASTTPPAATAGLLDSFIPTAFAQTKQPEVKTYSLPEESATAQLWQGISGTRSDRVWFVVAATYETSQLEKARALILRIRQSTSGFNPEIYKNDKYYAVVIGANLTYDQARARKQKAVEAKVPTEGDIYLYNPWDSK